MSAAVEGSPLSTSTGSNTNPGASILEGNWTHMLRDSLQFCVVSPTKDVKSQVKPPAQTQEIGSPTKDDKAQVKPPAQTRANAPEEIILLTLRTPQKHAVTISVTPNTTIGTIKLNLANRIADGKTIDFDIALVSAGVILANSSTVKSCGINDQSVVYVCVSKKQKKPELRLTIKTMTGTTFIIEIEPSATIAILKQKIESVYGVHPSNQRLYVNGRPLKHEQITLIDEFITNETPITVTIGFPAS